MACGRWRRGLLVPIGLLLAILSTQFRLPGAADAPDGEQLASCINDGLRPQAIKFDHMAKGWHARLRAEQVLWSRKAAASQITVVTSFTPSRLGQLEAQCRSYKGPISAAAYLPFNVIGKEAQLTEEHKEELLRTRQNLQHLHARMESGDNCQLDLILLSEFVGDELAEVMFPVNGLRNYALLQARTSLVAMVDVDLVISNTLLEWLKVPSNQNNLTQHLSSNKAVVVLPAFQTAPKKDMAAAHQLAHKAALMNKDQLLKLVDEDEVYQFHVHIYPRGHSATNYAKWFPSKELYKAQYNQGYEPWFIVDRFQNHWYDEVFRGYGWNKVTHVMHLHHKRFTFLVHPTGFLVHRQHEHSHADKLYKEQKAKYEADVKANRVRRDDPGNNMVSLTHYMKYRVTAALANGTYVPLVNPSIRQCVLRLPWWKEPAPPQAPAAAAAAAPSPSPSPSPAPSPAPAPAPGAAGKAPAGVIRRLTGTSSWSDAELLQGA